MTCEDVRDVAGELALDVLDGDERAAALAHLQTCAACRDEVASLTRAADELFLLVPEVEPAPGLEERVLARIGDPAGPAADAGRATAPPPAPARPRPARVPRRRLLAAAAALVVAATTATLALAALDPGAGPPGRTVDMSTAAGQVVGEVTLERNPGTATVTIPDWLALVDRYGGTVDGPYWLMVRTSQGTLDLHRLAAADERPWEIALRADPAQVRSVSVVDDNGTVWCSARFET